MTISLRPLSELAPEIQADNSDKIRKAAAGFEALFVAQLLRSARESAGAEHDQSGATMMEVAEEHIAQAISEGGGLGLSQSIVDSFKQLGASPASNTKATKPASEPLS